MAYVVVARWIAEAGQEEAVAAAIDALIEPSRAEPGNLLYQPHRDPGDPRVFLFYEQYVDEDAFKAHAASEHFKRYGHDALSRLETRERAFYETW